MPVKVSILAVGRVQLPVALGVSKEMVSITYSAGGAFPRIAYVEAEKDTPEERRRVITEDLKKAAAEVPPTLELT
jgi:hypothetical protein